MSRASLRITVTTFTLVAAAVTANAQTEDAPQLIVHVYGDSRPALNGTVAQWQATEVLLTLAEAVGVP